MMFRAYDARHGEYMPPSKTWDLLFDPTEYEGATPEQLRTVAQWHADRRGMSRIETASLLAQMGNDIQWSIIIVMEDRYRAEAFEEMLDDLSTTPTGDDDRYDYWPSGVLLAEAIAPTKDDVERLRDLAVGVL